MMRGSERMSQGRGRGRPDCPPSPVVGDWSTLVTATRDELLGLAKGLGHGRRIDHPIHGIKPLDYEFDYEDVNHSPMSRAIQFSYWSQFKTPPGSPVAQSNKYGGAPAMSNDNAPALLCKHGYQSLDERQQYIAQHSNTRGIGDNGSSGSPPKTSPSVPVMGAWQEMPKGKGRGRGLHMIRNSI